MTIAPELEVVFKGIVATNYQAGLVDKLVLRYRGGTSCCVFHVYRQTAIAIGMHTISTTVECSPGHIDVKLHPHTQGECGQEKLFTAFIECLVQVLCSWQRFEVSSRVGSCSILVGEVASISSAHHLQLALAELDGQRRLPALLHVAVLRCCAVASRGDALLEVVSLCRHRQVT